MFDRYFMFNGRNSKDFNLLIQNDFEVQSGGADVSYTAMPGRNLDIVNANNRYNNGSITYECYIDIRWFKKSLYSNLSELRRDLIYWLEVSENYNGYCKLVDNLDNDYYYLARLSKTPSLSFVSPECATITIEFNIGPMKYRLGSQEYRSIESGVTVINPEPIDSEPIFKVEGIGPFNLKVNDMTYKITSLGGLIYIDSEKHRVYDHNGLKNNVAVFPNYKYPLLHYGENKISWDNSSATVSVKYNWRMLA